MPTNWGFSPEEKAYYASLALREGGLPEGIPAGFIPDAGGGMPPQDMGSVPGGATAGLQGGWAHIQEDPMSFIRELLTPRNVQRTTQLPGGSYFGPDREASIPQENFAQARQLLDMMNQMETKTRDDRLNKRADELLGNRLEAERGGPAYSPGSITMGGRTEQVGDTIGPDGHMIPGKIAVDSPMSPTEISALGAGGYEMPPVAAGGGRGGSGGGEKTGPAYGDVTDRAEFLQKTIDADRAALAGMDPESQPAIDLQGRIAKTQTALDALLSGGGGGVETPPNTWRPGAGYNPNDTNRNGYTEETQGMGGGGSTVSPAGSSVAGAPADVITQANSTFQPKQVTPFTTENFGEGAGFVTDPNAPPPISEMDKPFYERGGLAATTDMIRGAVKGIKNMNERALMKEQGINPDTGELITPEDRYAWSQLKPWVQEHNLQVLQNKDSRMANLDALGYPPYQPARG